MPEPRPRVQPPIGPFFQPRRLGHANLYVSDLDRTMGFYINVIGIEEAYRTPLRGGGFVSNGNTHHDIGFVDVRGSLGRARGAQAGRLNHLGFELESEAALVESYRLAAAAGQNFSRTADHDIVHSVYGDDSDGNKFELYADITKDWRNQRTGCVTKPKPTWTPGLTRPVTEHCYHVDPPIHRVAEAIFHPQRTTHAAVVMRDLAAAILCYTHVVGLRVLGRDGAGEFAILGGTCGQPSLTLFAAANGRRPGIHHTGLVVASREDLDRSVARARREGIDVAVDVTHCGRRAVLVRDPDGFLVQLYNDADTGLNAADLDPGLALYLL